MIKTNTALNRLAFFTIGISFLVWCAVLFKKYYFFGYYDWDLANLAQIMWCFANGLSRPSLIDIHAFGDHALLFSLVILPIYKICQHPLTLITLKIIAFHATAFSLHYIARKYLDEIVALFFVLIFLIFPSTIFANIYEFNFDCFVSFFILWAIYFYKEKNLKGFWLMSLLMICVKENFSLILVTFGMFGLFRKGGKEKIQWGILPIVMGAGIFYMLTHFFILHFRGRESYAFALRYHHLGGSLEEIFKNILFHPLNTLGLIFCEGNRNFLFDLFGPLWVTSVLSPHILLLGASLFLQHLLSVHPPEHTIYYHYGHALVPFIFMSSIYTFVMLGKFVRVHILRGIIISFFILFLVTNVYQMRMYQVKLNFHSLEVAAQNQDLLNDVPKDASIIATFEYLAPLSQRKFLYSFHKVYDSDFQQSESAEKNVLYTGKSFQTPDHVEYALINFQDGWLRGAAQRDPKAVNQRVEAFLKSSDWKEKKAYGSRVLFQR